MKIGARLRSSFRQMKRAGCRSWRGEPGVPLRARRHRRRDLVLEGLEPRRLLSGTIWSSAPIVDLTTDPTTAVVGVLNPLVDRRVYQFTLDQDGLLSVDVHGVGFDTSVSLLDRNQQMIIASQAGSATNPDDWIDQHLSAGTYYLGVQGKDGVGLGSYTVSTRFIGTTSEMTELSAGAGPMAVTSGDFNGDGQLDLAAADNINNQVLVYINAGDGTFEPPEEIPVDSGPTAIAAVDLTHDGILDLITVNQFSNDVSILMGRGDGTFEPARSYSVGSYPTALAIADFNGDGDLDLATANQDSNNVSILMGRGDGTFAPQTVIATGEAPDALATGDFNRDGHADLIVGDHQSAMLCVLLGRGDGTFAPGRPVRPRWASNRWQSGISTATASSTSPRSTN